MRTVHVGTRLIGDGQPCFVAAEIGINHNGDIGLAHELIDAAADCGADGVKFQNYRVEDFLSDTTLTYEYISKGRTVVEPQLDMFRRCELASARLLELREHCDRRGIVFFSTPMGEKGVDDLVAAGSKMIKNGSDCLCHLPLIQKMAKTGLPVVISTGMGSLGEIDGAVRAFTQAGGQELILLHCTSSYPTPDEDVHLRKIPSLRSAFGCPVGLSDHTWGIIAAVGAVAFGACFIEKHFTLDKNLEGPDHRFSSDPRELQELVTAVRRMEKNLGNEAIGPAPSEELGRRDFRLSCAAATDLPVGHCLARVDIAMRRPGTGWPPSEIDFLIGRRVCRPVPEGKLLEPADFV